MSVISRPGDLKGSGAPQKPQSLESKDELKALEELMKGTSVASPTPPNPVRATVIPPKAQQPLQVPANPKPKKMVKDVASEEEKVEDLEAVLDDILDGL